MEKQNSFKELEALDQRKPDNSVKTQVLGSIMLYQNLFQVLELFSSRFTDSIQVMAGGKHDSEQKKALPPHGSGEAK